jgi:hypothetical protein
VVAFATPRASDVKVQVFDVSGRLAASPASGPHAAGRYQVRWGGTSADRAPAGVYFVRLMAPGTTLVKRFALAR